MNTTRTVLSSANDKVSDAPGSAAPNRESTLRAKIKHQRRREDRGRFTALGFVAQDWNEPGSPLVVMCDEEADYAHTGNLPRDIPYHGHNAPGGSYGSGEVACDGRDCAEVETGSPGGFVIDWDIGRDQPTGCSLRNIRRYLKINARVERRFARLTQPSTHKNNG